MKLSFDIVKLVDVIVKFLISINHTSPTDLLDKSNPTRRNDINNLWNGICKEYFGFIDYNSCLNLKAWWTRNTHNLRQLVISKLERLFEQINHEDNVMITDISKFKVHLTSIEWETVLKKYKKDYKDRSILNTEFSDFLSQKLQNLGINCWFVCKHNWFKKVGSQKNSSGYWRGIYTCRDKASCSNKVEALIRNSPSVVDGIDIEIILTQTHTHNQKISKTIRCSGSKRVEQAKELAIKGISNVKAENILNNLLTLEQTEQKVTNRHTLAMISSEYRNRDRLSADFFGDANIAKLLTDNICLPIKGKINGYIQEISLSPFGFLTMSDLQLSIWEKIEKENSIWFFDATGNVIRSVNRQKKPFLYSLTMHDVEHKSIIPFAEFVTTSHTQSNIAKYLTTIQTKLEETKTPLPETVVTDMSWALINATCISFNKCRIQNYINWCYMYIYDGVREEKFLNIIKTKLQLCSTHFIHNIAKNSKKINCVPVVRQTFMYFTALLQNSNSVEEIENYLTHIYNVFNNKFADGDMLFSLNYLSNISKTQDYGYLANRTNQNEKERDRLFEEFLNESNIYVEDDVEQTIRNSSPFKTRYEEILSKKQIEIDNSEKLNSTNVINEFYCPQLFELIKDKLYNIPMWTGLMLRTSNKIKYNCKTRLNNIPVENWFNQIKNFILKRLVYTSEFASLSYKNLMGKYFEIYGNIQLNKETVLKKFQEYLEQWKPRSKKKGHKGTYFDDFELKKLNTAYDYSVLNKLQMNFHFDNLTNRENKLLEEMEHDGIFEHIEQTNSSIHMNEPTAINPTEHLIEQIQNSIYDQIQNNNSYEEIKRIILANEQIFDSIIKSLREMQVLSYSNQNEKRSKQVLDTLEHYKLLIGLNDSNLFPIYSTGDGNCLFNSISLIYFGNQDYSKLIKMSSLYVLLKYEQFFTSVLFFVQLNNDFRTFIQKTRKNGEWSDATIILSLCVLFGRNIYCFNPGDLIQKTIVYYKYWPFEQDPICADPIMIGFCHNHFFPVLKKQNTSINFNSLDSTIRQLDYFNSFIKVEKLKNL